jgi:hypothetical protein
MRSVVEIGRSCRLESVRETGGFGYHLKSIWDVLLLEILLETSKTSEDKFTPE